MVDGKSVELSETLVRIDDPVANTETKWDTSLKQVKVVHFSSLSEPTPAMRDRIGAFSFDGLAKRAGATKLGTREIQGLSVEGTRYQTENSTHECWFSPDLKLTVRKTDEFSDCAFTDQLEGISLQEPDVSRYLPPPDYSVKHVHIDLSRLPK